MTATPSQLQAWREEANIQFFEDVGLNAKTHPLTAYQTAYIRAKQETEQIMKLARFGAMVADSQFNKDGCSEAYIQDVADECGLFLNRSDEFAPNIEATIEELINDPT